MSAPIGQHEEVIIERLSHSMNTYAFASLWKTNPEHFRETEEPPRCENEAPMKRPLDFSKKKKTTEGSKGGVENMKGHQLCITFSVTFPD